MKNKRRKIEEIANLIEKWKSLNRSVKIKEICSNGVTLAVAYLLKAVYAFLNCSKRLKDMARRISILLLWLYNNNCNDINNKLYCLKDSFQ